MKMDIRFQLAVALTVSGFCLLSCDNDVETPADVVPGLHGAPIEFSVSIDGDERTRADVAEDSVTVFYVTAYKYDKNNNFVQYFPKTKVVAGEDGGYIPETELFWPYDETEIYFSAFSFPEPDRCNDYASSFQAYYYLQPNSHSQEPALYAYVSGNKESCKDGVLIQFKQALSCIEVKAKNTNEEFDINAIGFAFFNYTYESRFDYYKSSGLTDGLLDKTMWIRRYSTTGPSRCESAEPVLLNEEPQYIGESMLMIPDARIACTGENDTEGIYLGIICNISQKGTGIYLLPNISSGAADGYSLGYTVTYGYACVAFDVDWEPGKRYIYTVDCSNLGRNRYWEPILTDDLEWTVEVKDWKTHRDVSVIF